MSADRATGRRWPPYRTRAGTTALLVAGAALLAFLVLPVAVLLLRALSPSVLATLAAPAATESLRLSLLTTAIAMGSIVLFGTPLAYLLARHAFPGKHLVATLVDIPVVLPPVVAGIALLLVFGRRGVIGGPLADAGIDLAFTTTAVVLAQVFVASPFYVRALEVGFRGVPRDLEAAARIDGADRWSAFWRVTWPLALPAFTQGFVLAWARALGEFGATIVFAGSLQGRTRTLPLAIYATLERDLDAALAIAGVLTVVALGLFLAVRVVVAQRAPLEPG